MKKVLLLIIGVCLAFEFSSQCANAQLAPGWDNFTPPSLEPLMVSPIEPPVVALAMSAESSTIPPSSNKADAVTQELAELAEALGNDVERIFLWVRNHIRFTHYYGCKKGATLTYYERSGNDVDQAALLAALLRAAGYSVRYNAAWCFADDARWAEYFGVEVGAPDAGPSSYQVWQDAVWAGGVPSGHFVSTNTFESPPRWGMTRYWVEVEEGGNWVRYDPSCKPFQRTEPQVDAALHSGYSRAALLSAAGGTTVTNGISGLNTLNLHAHLGARAAALEAHVRTEAHALTAMEAFGGAGIAPLQPVTPGVLAVAERFPWDVPGWTSFPLGADGSELLPDSLMSTLQLQLSATKNGTVTLNHTFMLPELAGRRLTLEFDGEGAANRAVLRLDDEIVASENLPVGSGIGCFLKSTILHAGTANQVPVDTSYLRGGRYVLIYAFDAGEHLLRARMSRLAAYKESGLEESSREVVVETLHVMGLSWLRQTELAGRAVVNAADLHKTNHHRFGRVAQEDSFYVDVGQQYQSIYRRRAAQAVSEFRVVQRAYSFLGSAMEHGVLAQTQAGMDGVSTVRLISLNNAEAVTPETYLATRSGGSTNWLSVKSQLSGYSAAEISSIESVMTSSDYVTAYALLPKRGNITREGWSGAGYILDREDSSTISVGMLISGQLNGGYATLQAQVDSSSSLEFFYTLGKADSPSSTLQVNFSNWAGDPVNLTTGFFTASGPGMSIGSAMPRGMSFGLDYDGIRRAEKAAGVGYGWDFNLNARLTWSSDYENAFGSHAAGTAEQGARLAFGVHVLLDLCRNLGTAKDWTVAQLTALWMVDGLANNLATASVNGSAHAFMKSADGTAWLPPPGSTLVFSPAAANISELDEVRERHGNTHRFNGEGKLVETEDPWGKKAMLNYTKGRLTQITDAYGRSFNLAWLGLEDEDKNNDLLDSVSDPQSTQARALDLHYDGQGRLVTITDPEGKSDRFEYDAQHRLIIQRDHDERVITHNTGFDSRHRVLEQKGQGLDEQTWAFRYAPGFVRVTDPAGAATLHEYDARGRPCAKTNPLGHTQRAVFDGQNRTVERHSPLGRSISTAFDAAHNQLSSTTSSGGVIPALSTTFQTYDLQHRLKTITDTRGHTMTYGYHGDADGISDPDARHLPTRVYQTVNGQLIETLTTYTSAGNVETITDPAGNVTRFEYDALDRLEFTRLPGPNNDYTQIIYTAAGDPWFVRNARGNVVTSSYNLRREIIGTSTFTTTVDGDMQTISTQQQYDNNRNLFKIVDALGNLTESTFSSTGKHLTTRHSFLPGIDLISNTYDERDLLATSSNVFGQTTTFTYDDAERLTDANDNLNRNTHTTYDVDDRTESVRNTLNQTSSTQYLDDVRKIQSINPMLQEWTLQRDAAGNITHRTNARGKTWTHVYDEAGRLISTRSPEGKIISITRNSLGLPESVVEQSGKGTSLSYDYLGRVIGAQSHLHDFSKIYDYDANSNITKITEIDWRFSFDIQDESRTYDEVDRLKTYVNAEGEIIKYVWDENNNLRFLEYPDQSRIEYQYDARDRLQYVKEAGITMAEFQWTDASQLKKVIRTNGTTRELFYDAANRLERIEERGPDGRLLYYQRHAFDAGDRMTQRLSLPGSAPWNEPQDTATFNDDNWMTSFNGTALNHDADGNLLAAPTRPAGAPSGTADASTTLIWDARNRLFVATTGSTSRYYTYSPGGHLTHLRSGHPFHKVGTRFTVNPHGAGGLSQVLVRTDLATGNKTKVIHGLGMLYERRADGSVRWYHHDHLGNTVALTDDAGTVTGRASYSLWGMAHGTSGDILSTPFLYNGRFGVVTELESGCLHMRARWYNPRIRRFLSSDPAGFDGGWNMFAYANGNPLAMVDPFGLGAVRSNESGFWSAALDSVIDYTWADLSGDVGGVLSYMGQGAANILDLIAQVSNLPFELTGTDPMALGPMIGGGEGALLRGLSAASSRLRALSTAKSAPETFYRAMSQGHYDQLLATGKLPATAETFISPTRAFAANYDGVLVQFNVRGGTTSALQGIGVRDASALTGQLHGGLPGVSKGWTSTNAFFKAEGTQVNIGLGRGAGLDTFNSNILNFQAIPK